MKNENWLHDMYKDTFNILNRKEEEITPEPVVDAQPEGVLLNEEEVNSEEVDPQEESEEESEEEFEFEENSEEESEEESDEEELEEDVSSDEDFIVALLEDVQLAANVELTEEEIEVILETVTLVVEGMVKKMGKEKSIKKC